MEDDNNLIQIIPNVSNQLEVGEDQDQKIMNENSINQQNENDNENENEIQKNKKIKYENDTSNIIKEENKAQLQVTNTNQTQNSLNDNLNQTQNKDTYDINTEELKDLDLTLINQVSENQKQWHIDILKIFPELIVGIEIDDIEQWINDLRSEKKALQLGCVWVVKCGKSYGKYPRKIELICNKNSCTGFFNLKVIESQGMVSVGNKYFLEIDSAKHDTHSKFTQKEIINRVNRIKSLKGTRVRKPKKGAPVKNNTEEQQPEAVVVQQVEKEKTEEQSKQEIIKQIPEQKQVEIKEKQEDDGVSSDISSNNPEFKPKINEEVPVQQEQRILRKRGRKPNAYIQQQQQLQEQQQLQYVSSQQYLQKPLYDYNGGGEIGLKQSLQSYIRENELLRKCLKQQEELLQFQKNENTRAKDIIVQNNIQIQQLQQENQQLKQQNISNKQKQKQNLKEIQRQNQIKREIEYEKQKKYLKLNNINNSYSQSDSDSYDIKNQRLNDDYSKNTLKFQEDNLINGNNKFNDPILGDINKNGQQQQYLQQNYNYQENLIITDENNLFGNIDNNKSNFLDSNQDQKSNNIFENNQEAKSNNNQQNTLESQHELLNNNNSQTNNIFQNQSNEDINQLQNKSGTE